MTKISKTIHYIWFGNGEKSELINKCISRNKEILSDWTFIEWNESNYDINKCQYMEEAYNSKKYAFASDFARFDILYKYGGVYLDTDVELIKRIPDKMMENDGFTGVESNNKIAPGLIFACEPGNHLVKEILDEYENEKFILENGKINSTTVVDIVTKVFLRHGFKMDGSMQMLNGFNIYPCEYFCAYDFVLDEFNITNNTISIHHYTATWTNNKSKIKKKIQRIIRKILGKKIYLKLINIKRKVLGIAK